MNEPTKCVNGGRVTRLLATLCWIAVLLPVGNASAQGTDPFESLEPAQAERLLRLMDQAQQAETEARWQDASDLYFEMWSILPVEEYRFREAFCLEQVAEYQEALTIYRELAVSPREEVARNAGGRVSVLEVLVSGLPARLRVATDRLGALVRVNDEAQGRTTEEGVVFEVPAGEYRISIQLEGYRPVDRTVTLDPGEERHLMVTLEESPRVAEAVEPPAEEPGPIAVVTEEESPAIDTEGLETEEYRRNLTLPLSLGGVAVAAAATGLTFAVLSESRADDYRSYDRGADGASVREFEQLADDADRFGTAANVSFAVAGAVAVGAFVSYFLVNDEPDTPTSDIALAPYVSPQGGGAVLNWTF